MDERVICELRVSTLAESEAALLARVKLLESYARTYREITRQATHLLHELVLTLDLTQETLEVERAKRRR